ncbi:hypothetical protein CASFOL_042959 [Castilleja foliolosa]|uniref:Uncharacterized protein n=1 Tax=Castilleja foliolosa TaxID=1961234 RepID=A0ABD3B7S4_9LAMI
MASKSICTSGDAVIVTKPDLEEYHSPCNNKLHDSGKELSQTLIFYKNNNDYQKYHLIS